MEYFHWFHGQQTRLHDANNTPNAAVGYRSLARDACFSYHDFARILSPPSTWIREYVLVQGLGKGWFDRSSNLVENAINLNFPILTSIDRVRIFDYKRVSVCSTGKLARLLLRGLNPFRFTSVGSGSLAFCLPLQTSVLNLGIDLTGKFRESFPRGSAKRCKHQRNWHTQPGRGGCLAIVVLVAGCINDTSPLHIRRKKLLSVFDEVAFRNDRYIDTSDPVLFVPYFFHQCFFFFFFFFHSTMLYNFFLRPTLEPLALTQRVSFAILLDQFTSFNSMKVPRIHFMFLHYYVFYEGQRN